MSKIQEIGLANAFSFSFDSSPVSVLESAFPCPSNECFETLEKFRLCDNFEDGWKHVQDTDSRTNSSRVKAMKQQIVMIHV